MNDLDRAIKAMQRSNAGAPEFYRQLAAGELWFLLPYHPEMEGGHMQIQNGSPFPFSVLTTSNGEEIVPIFSSEARLEESLKVAGVPPNTFLCGKMPAVQVLEVIGKCGLRVVVNKSCATGELTLPAELLCDLADGSIFHSTAPQETKQAAVTILNPADYPTDLIQRAFEFIRQYRVFRAAWVFSLPATDEGQPKYQLLFLMSPQDKTLLHDLNLALNCSPPKGIAFEIGIVEETATVQVMTLFVKAQPFYLAQDFVRPTAE